jgi:MYXO-CTERM domain-containing protein
MSEQTVPLYTVTSGRRVNKARKNLDKALEEGTLGDPDDAGSFFVSVEAETPEDAVTIVNEALAKAGAGDDFVIRETTAGREMADGDPRQGGSDEAAPTTDPDPASEAAADAAVTAEVDAVAEPEPEPSADADATSEAVDAPFDPTPRESEQAGTTSPWKGLAPIGALLVLLFFVRRRRRR